MSRTRSLPAILALGATALLGGCISIGPKPPESLLSVSATATVPPGTTLTATDKTAVSVITPSVPQALATQRVAVIAGGNAVAYLKGGLWSEAPNRLFREIVAETIQVRTGRIVPDQRYPTLSPDTRLGGRLELFGLDAGQNQAVVRYEATLTRSGTDQTSTRRFEARVPVSAQDPTSVAAGINQAANQVATEVADWVGR